MPPPPRGGIRFDSRQVYPFTSSPGMIPLPPGLLPCGSPSRGGTMLFHRAGRRQNGKPPAARRELKLNYYTKKRGGSRREIRGNASGVFACDPPAAAGPAIPRRRGGDPQGGGG